MPPKWLLRNMIASSTINENGMAEAFLSSGSGTFHNVTVAG